MMVVGGLLHMPSSVCSGDCAAPTDGSASTRDSARSLLTPAASSGRRSTAASVMHALRQRLLRSERLFDLPLDALVVLRDEALFVVGQDSKRHAHEAVLELHVEPMLAVGDAAGDLEVEAADAGAVVTEVDLVERQRPGIESGQEQDGARP